MSRFDRFFAAEAEVEQENATRLQQQQENVERMRIIKEGDVQRSLNKEPLKAPRVLDTNGKIVVAGETLRYKSYMRAVCFFWIFAICFNL